jgi:catechol 2,3-dioxygenase-like lactoylglutathione lyase family enzyme
MSTLFERVTIRASDLEASERFYETVLRTLGGAHEDFALVAATAGERVTRHLHIAFFAPSRGHVDEFWRAGTEAGYRDDGAPGPRPEYSEDYYGGFLLDPDGNSAEAVHHGNARTPGRIDHLWIRVADVAASTRFYEGLAARVGFRVRPYRPDRTQIAGEDASFSVVAGEPTEHAHMTFPAGEDDTLHDPDGNTVELVRR